MIADVVMPGMGGKRLAAEMRAALARRPVLFTSGYTGVDAVQRGLLDEGPEFMQKPLEPRGGGREGPRDPGRAEGSGAR